MKQEQKIRTEPIGKEEKGIYVSVKSAVPTNTYCIPDYYIDYLKCIYLSKGQLIDRIDKLAYMIYNYYKDVKEDVVFLVIMKGGIEYFKYLGDKIIQIAEVDKSLGRRCFIQEFLRMNSYVGMKKGDTKLESSSDEMFSTFTNKHILVVEDILDTGINLSSLIEILAKYNPLSIKSTCLISKRTDRCNCFVPDWVGFDIDDYFIVGFGCDINEYFRDLAHLAILNDKGVTKFA